MRLLRLSMLLIAIAPVAAIAQAVSPAPTPDAKPGDQADQQQNGTPQNATPPAPQRIRPAQAQPGGGSGFGGGGNSFFFRAEPLEKAPWIGISTSAPAAALRHQLKLPAGTGLVVEFVQPKSPAEKAGVKQYDLLIRLDDQLLVNSEQFAVLVRTFKPGDEVKLRLLREGTEQTISVKLVEREMPRLGSAVFQPWLNSNPVPPPVEMMPGTPQPPATSDGQQFTSKSVTFMDGKRQLKIESSDGHHDLTATDKGGKVLYQGPIDTQEQRNALPPDLRAQLERVLKLFPSALDAPKTETESEPGDPNPFGKEGKPKPKVEQN